jgi:alcohol dehydrogenase
MCEMIIKPGGCIANVGVHGKSVELHLEKLWASNITITTRLVDTVTTPMLLKMVESGKLHPDHMITHHFKLDEIMKAYDTFGDAAHEKALKVVLEN